MSDIYGTTIAEPAAPSIAQMGAALFSPPWHRQEQACLPGASLAAFSLEGQALFQLGADQNAFLVAIAGEILEYDFHRQHLERLGCNFVTRSHAELFLRGFLLESSAFVRRLEGSFALALWDARVQRLHLISDRFGLKPLHYAVQQGRLSFSSKILPLLRQPGVSTHLSETGIAQFFRFRQFLGEDTLYKDVHLLPAGSWLTFDVATRSVAIDSYWDLSKTFDWQPYASDSAALERIDAAFSHSMQRCLSDAGSLGLSLSAGLDSRSILAFVPRQQPLTCVTLGSLGSIDLRLARQLADCTGRAQHACVLDASFQEQFETHLRQMVRLTDGHYVSSAIVMPSLEIYRRLGVRTLLRGHGGELMHMDKAYNYSLTSHSTELEGKSLGQWLYRRLGSGLPEDMAQQLLRPPFRQSVVEASHASLDAAFEEASTMWPPAHRISYVFIRQFLRRTAALSMAKFGSVVETRLPFIDREVIAALMAASPSLKRGDTIQAWLLSRHAPALLRVPNSNTGAPLGAGSVRRALAYGRIRVFARLGIPGYQPYERLGRWLRQGLQPIAKGILLSESCLDRGVLAPETVRQVLDDHVDGRRNHTYLIMTMLAFELGQREADCPVNPR